MMDKLEKVLMPLADILTKNRVLIAIRDGFLITTPLLIVGSIFLLFANFPIPGWEDFWTGILGTDWAGWFTAVSRASFNCTGLLTALGTGYAMAREFGGDKIQGAAVAMVAFFIMMPTSHLGSDADGNLVEGVTVSGLSFDYIGPNGIFMALIAAILGVWLFCYAYKKGWTIKMPAGVPPTVEESFAALIPAAMVMIVFFTINLLFGFLGTNVFQIIFEFLQTPLLNLGDTLGAMVVAYIFLHLFWFFGVNGGSVVGAVFNPILQTLSAGNIAGEHHIICQQFQDLFATFGGAGSTLSLVIAMLLFCKSKRITNLGKLSFVPGIFGINEPIVFGLPIVLNPTLLIPFVLVPTVNIVISYFAMAMNLVPICSGINIPWTTPIVISGFLATNWAGALLQVLLLILGIFIYMPFIKIMDKQYLEEENNMQNDEEEEDDISLDDLSFDDL